MTIDSEISNGLTHKVGDVIADKYRLERVLGEGGQACVWQARNLVLDVDVALKFVTGSGGDGAQSARLLIEARAAAKLRHPGIVRVIDFGRTETGDSFLVLELLEGESLAHSIASNGRLAPERAVALLLPIAEALAEAHAAGIVHRDIKPANIFLAASDGRVQPKLLDFGIAKVENGLSLPAELTRAGSIVGSPAYLSPEQARGEGDPDHRVDVWAFATTLYQALTGQLPFPENTYNALLWAIVQNEVRPTVEFGAGDEALWSIVARGLAKSRTERWGSMDELGRELAAWLFARGVTEDATGAPLGLRWLAARAGSRQESDKSAPSSRPPRSLDSTAQLHPPLSRSVPSAVASPARRRARLAVAAAVAGCALGLGFSFFDQRATPVGNALDARPAAALGAREEGIFAATAAARAPRSEAEAGTLATDSANAPVVVPAEERTAASLPLSVAGASPRSPTPKPRAPAAAAPAPTRPASSDKLPRVTAVSALAFAPKAMPLQASTAVPREDPGAELLNPY